MILLTILKPVKFTKKIRENWEHNVFGNTLKDKYLVVLYMEAIWLRYLGSETQQTPLH